MSVKGLPQHNRKKLPYPKSVFFIVSNEFCERFSYYGMRTILSIYLTNVLLYTESTAKIIYHTFTMFVYFFPLLGAMLADSWLGKFKTILYVSMIYAVGNIVLALAATTPLHLPDREFSLLGLLLIAVGTGGIKPCVSAFGGDQFTLPQQETQLAMFFSMFYFAINAGSLISTAITPIIREDVHCFENQSCYPLAFAIPGILMIVSIAIFAFGKPLYKIRKPQGNMVIKVSKCIGHAIKMRSKLRKTEKKEHWLDYAEEKYGKRLVEDIKATLKVLFLYIPLPIFWALFDQQGTAWTFQARRMDGDLGFYTILPDQMQVVNPLLILAFIPLFQYVIYPVLNKCKLLRKPLQRLVAGGVLAAVAFAISASISLALENENPILPSTGIGQLRIYNNLKCDVKLQSEIKTNNIASMTTLEMINLEVNKIKSMNYALISDCPIKNKDGQFEIKEKTAVGYFFQDDQFVKFEDSIEKEETGLPRIRFLLKNSKDTVTLNTIDGLEILKQNGSNTTISNIQPGTYKLTIESSKNTTNTKDIVFKLGAVYAILYNDEIEESKRMEQITVTAPNSLHMLLLIIQYVIITMAEIMFSITGLEFSYSQAPVSMKSVLQACWLLTTAIGNLIVVIIESAEIFEAQSSNFFLYAVLMLVDMAVFSLMAMKYKYVEKQDSISEELDLNEDANVKGIDNKGFNKSTDD